MAETFFARVRRSRVVTALLWAAAIVLVGPAILYMAPQLTGNDHAYLVLSGSMIPAFAPGDIVFVENVAPGTLRPGDVVTFHPPESRAVVTHRVVEVVQTADGPRYRTWGDNNEDPDPFLVSDAQVVGRMTFLIPKWGLLQEVVRTKAGYVAFVLLPGLIVIGAEFRSLYQELDARYGDRARGIRSLLDRLEHEEREDRIAAWLARVEREP